MSVRQQSAKILLDVLQHRGSLAALDDAGDKATPEQREICFGVMRWHRLLLAILHTLMDKPLRRKDQDVEVVLLIGLYQLQFMRTPAYAAVSESVKLAKTLKKPWARGLINGVLREFDRNGEALIEALPQADKDAFPDWLAARLHCAWPDQATEIMRVSNQRPPMTLRVNSSRWSVDEALRALGEHDIEAKACAFSPTAITLASAKPVSELPRFTEGALSVQDEAAQLSAPLFTPSAGDMLLDACAAPGGKTGHLLELHPDVRVHALDQSAPRLARVADNLQRLGLEATLSCGDASQPEQWSEGPYQGILLDVPCSATGVIRRHPDIKHLRRESDIAELSAVQAKILAACWAELAPGGTLVYASCSILPEENEQIIAAFVASQSDATHDPIEAEWGEKRPFGRQLLPAAHDGFYYARLIKSG